jgi:signal peptidase I
MADILLVAYLAVLLAAAVITVLKGKWGMLVVGVAFGFAWVLASLRLAKPGSLWSRWFYDRDKQKLAREVAPFRRRLATVGGLISVLVVAAIFGLLKAYRIPSSAMEPTLLCATPGLGCTADQSDRLIAVRYLFRKRPERGDLVAFKVPDEGIEECGSPPGAAFIKRVIALPGETWEMRNGFMYIRGQRLQEPYVAPDRRDVEFRTEQRVPADHFLVLGDNRPQSCDSRVWGPLPRKNLVAKVVLRYWPLSRAGRP